ncbi:MAG: cytochrome c oxidase subunit II [Thermoleophilaceae bacterium]
MTRRTVQPRRFALLAFLATLAGALIAPAMAAAGVFTPEAGGSPNADDIDSLYRIVLYVAIPIFLIVEGTLLWSLIKFRQRRGGPEPAQIRGNTPLELGWTVGAALILVVLAVITFLYLGDIKNPPASGPNGLASATVQVASVDQPDPPRGTSDALNIDVNGQQYLWRFDHPGDEVYDYYELVVPTDTTVVLQIRASDVQHSWWIPELGGKMDAVPGHTNETWFKIAKEGVYEGQCAELCGSNHADMRARVRAVSPDDYVRYVNDRQEQIKQAQKDLSAQRTELEGAGQ